MKKLTTDQMLTLLKTLSIFVENRDPFTTENIVNELKREKDQFNGFYDDYGNSIADELYAEIDDAIDSLIIQYFPDFVTEQRRVYIYEPREAKTSEYDEEETLNDYEVDKEGNRLPNHEEICVDTNEEDEVENRGAGWYKDQDGNWEWDRDAAASAEYEEDMYDDTPEFDDPNDQAAANAINSILNNTGEYEDPDWSRYKEDNCNYGANDHVQEHELYVDKNKRINIGKKILVKKVGYNEDDSVFVIGKKNGREMFIIKTTDLNFELGDDEIMYGEYQLNKGALRLGIANIFEDVRHGDVIYCKVHYPVMCTDDNSLYVYVYLKD